MYRQKQRDNANIKQHRSREKRQTLWTFGDVSDCVLYQFWTEVHHAELSRHLPELDIASQGTTIEEAKANLVTRQEWLTEAEKSAGRR